MMPFRILTSTTAAFLLALQIPDVLSLYPRESPSREVKELDGLWHFRADYSDSRNAGFDLKWYEKPLSQSGDTILMPVPSSFNDITQNSSLRDFVGWVWYDRQVWIPDSWIKESKTIKLQFGSVNYNAEVWVNGKLAMSHSGGHLPFEKDISSMVHSEKPNTITVAANNTLSPTTVPPGTLNHHDGMVTQNVQMDFFNYAGILRPVKLYTVPPYINLEDVTINSSINEDMTTANISFDLVIGGTAIAAAGSSYSIALMSRGGGVVANCSGMVPSPDTRNISVAHGQFTVSAPNLWWPWTMSDSPGFLYVFQVTLIPASGDSDVYRQPYGIRTVSISSDNQFLINNKPFYFHGLGKHEDADIRGRGYDNVLNLKDINLLKWLGANSFRTAVYPNSEEMMDLCDKYGLVVIDETPAVGIKKDNFSPETLAQHIQELTELVTRDKNRPSVVMWALANEPDSNQPESEAYFKAVAERAKTLDSRPITMMINKPYNEDKVGQFLDVICINKYYGWYFSPGNLEVISIDLPADLEAWHNFLNKPIILSEYGAGAISGTHEDPPTMYTENYQAALYLEHFKVLDTYKNKFLVGELVWTFADFNTAQTSSRAHGNRKGVLTRQRQPKQAAYLVRDRYLSLAKAQDFCYGKC